MKAIKSKLHLKKAFLSKFKHYIVAKLEIIGSPFCILSTVNINNQIKFSHYHI